MAEVTYVGRLVRPEVPDRHWADGLERVVEVHGLMARCSA